MHLSQLERYKTVCISFLFTSLYSVFLMQENSNLVAKLPTDIEGFSVGNDGKPYITYKVGADSVTKKLGSGMDLLWTNPQVGVAGHSFASQTISIANMADYQQFAFVLAWRSELCTDTQYCRFQIIDKREGNKLLVEYFSAYNGSRSVSFSDDGITIGNASNSNTNVIPIQIYGLTEPIWDYAIPT